jgi:hypothetical protein
MMACSPAIASMTSWGLGAGWVQQRSGDAARPPPYAHLRDGGVQVALNLVEVAAQVPLYPRGMDLVPVSSLDLDDDEHRPGAIRLAHQVHSPLAARHQPPSAFPEPRPPWPAISRSICTSPSHLTPLLWQSAPCRQPGQELGSLCTDKANAEICGYKKSWPIWGLAGTLTGGAGAGSAFCLGPHYPLERDAVSFRISTGVTFGGRYGANPFKRSGFASITGDRNCCGAWCARV